MTGAVFHRRNRAGKVFPWLILLGCWLVYFFPVIFLGMNYNGYPVMAAPGITGMPAHAPRGVSEWNRFPNGDLSLPLLHYPYARFIAENYRHGRFPSWDPDVGCGYPGMQDPQFRYYNPFMLPMLLLPNAHGFWLGLALQALFGLVGFFLFFKKLGIQAVPAAAWAAFAVFNPWTQQTLVLSNPWAFWLLGWGLYCAIRAAEGPVRWAVLPAAASVLMLYCGHPSVAVLLTVFVGGAYFTFLHRAGKTPVRLAAACLLFAGVVLLLSAAYWVPLLAHHDLLFTYKSVVKSLGGYALPPGLAAAKKAWIPPILWFLMPVMNPLMMIWVTPFVAALAVLAVFRHRGRVWLPAAALVFSIFMLFRWSHLEGLRYLLSGGALFKAIYFRALFWPALIWLAAVGGREITAPGPEAERKTNFRIILYVYLAYLGLNGAYSLRLIPFWPARLPWITAILAGQALLLVAARYLPRFQIPAFFGAVALVLVPQIILPAAPFRYLGSRDPAVQVPQAVRYIQENGNPHLRIYGVYSSGRASSGPMPVLSPNQAMLWGLRDIRQVSPINVSSYQRLDRGLDRDRPVTTALDFKDAGKNLLRWLGVEFVVAPHGHTNIPGYARVWSGTVLDVWKSSRPVFRASMVYRWTSYRTQEEAGLAFRNALAHGRGTTWASLKGPAPKPESGTKAPQWRIRWLEDTPDRIALKVATAAPGLLVLADTGFPGWSCRVDGHAARIYSANGTFRAVRIPGGAHEVIMRFSSPAFEGGLAAMLAGWALVALLFVWGGMVEKRRRGVDLPRQKGGGNHGPS